LPPNSTLTEGPAPTPTGERSGPYLFRVFDADAPLAPTLRCALRDLDLVKLGRGDVSAAVTGKEGDVRTANLSFADKRMSSQHAKLTRVLGKWLLEDAGSKNGVLLNAERCTRAELQDGDLIELGRTLLVFRDGLASPRLQPPLLQSDALKPLAAGLATMNPDLEFAFAQLERVAKSMVPVALGGPTGSGKEVIARAVHALSGRKGPFIPVNCGALPDTLVESELFGHKKGAFSGATEDRPGLVRSAHGGTLFLDEIGDLPLEQQPALLRVLQEKVVQPIGSSAQIPVDVRVVSATHHDLAAAVDREEFRADLRARLTGHALELPALLKRREDLGLLVASLLQRLAGPRAAQVRFSLAAARSLFLYAWPLNVRELEKVLETSLALAGDGEIEPAHLPAALRDAKGRPKPAVQPTGEGDELRVWLEQLLREHQGNISAASRASGKARMQLQRWMKRFGLAPASFKA
jgi:DNA-binding NtrC family response regulator